MPQIDDRTSYPLDGDLARELRELVQGAIKTETGTTYTLLAADFGRRISFNNASPITVTVPSGLPTNFYCFWRQRGAGQITFVASGTTLLSTDAKLKSNGQYSTGFLDWDSSEVYILDGNLAA